MLWRLGRIWTCRNKTNSMVRKAFLGQGDQRHGEKELGKKESAPDGEEP